MKNVKHNPLEMNWWRIGQCLVWVLGFAIFMALIFKPQLGLHAFWDVLIPLAPAIIVMAPGLWRNVCPIASVSLVSRQVGWSRKKRISRKTQALLTFWGLAFLLLLIPLRHLIFNTNATATAVLLAVLSLSAFLLGWVYDWKSAWCAGICPVHQVEKLYGSHGAQAFTNAHCDQCHNCSIPCPDSTKEGYTTIAGKQSLGSRSTLLLCAGFPGYIWGWFHVSDFTDTITFSDLLYAFMLPTAGFIFSFLTFNLLYRILPRQSARNLGRIYTALAVSLYYWFRIPALLGFGVYPGDGTLIDLRGTIPYYLPIVVSSLAVIFFFWWFLRPRKEIPAWLIRPDYARK